MKLALKFSYFFGVTSQVDLEIAHRLALFVADSTREVDLAGYEFHVRDEFGLFEEFLGAVIAEELF